MENLKLTPYSEWGLKRPERPIVIAGPCSAETEEQVMQTAHAIEDHRVSVFRAGIWKPRTRPSNFEGVGEEGLAWLKRVKEETNLQVTTEVANSRHVDLAMKYGLDMLWIGARTSANPFAMQEIADSLRGRNVTVLVKNPVNPDLGLWMGAIERLAKVGITRLGAIHRGFSAYEKTQYRNQPQWQIPVELKRRIPDLPLIVDPSHIGGKRELICPIAQKALDLNYDGMIIETHPDPDNAWSDAKQQITPQRLIAILDKLALRMPHSDNDMFLHSLEELRAKIDQLDEEVLRLLAQRMMIVEEIGRYKKANHITIFQPERWNEIITNNVEKAKDFGFSRKFLEGLFQSIHQESINHQNEIMNEDEETANQRQRKQLQDIYRG